MPTTQKKKRIGRSLVALVAGTVLAIVYATPAFAASHVATILPGSVLSVGTSAFFPGTPACDDGVDNDGDGDIDGADGQCASATDASESEAGGQPFTPPTATFEESGGVVSNLDLHFQQAEICDAGTGICIDAQITGDDGTGTWNSGNDGAALQIDISVELTNGPFGWQDCSIDVPDVDLTGTITNGATGSVSGSEPVAALDPGECGGFFGIDYADIVNDVVDLPNTANATLNLSVSPALPS